MDELHSLALATAPRVANFQNLFQQKAENLSRDQPGHRALYRLLANIVGSYIEAFDEEPLPVGVAHRAHQHLLALLASLDVRANADRQLADINRVAGCDLWH